MDNEKLSIASLQANQIQSSSSEGEDEQFVIGESFAVLLEYRWLVAAITAVCISIGAGYLFVAKPIYKADGLLQVEERGGGGISSALKDLEPIVGDSTTVAAELEILNSRLVLGRAIERLSLNIHIEPKYFPLFGSAVARRHRGDGLNSAPLGFDKYAWGGELVQVDSLDVPRRVEDKALVLHFVGDGAYKLFDSEGEFVLQGNVGQRSSASGYSIYISKLIARPGTEFKVVRRSTETAVELLRRVFIAKERGKKSGIVEVTLNGPEQEKIGLILDEILKTYVRQNVDKRSAEAEKTLKFLENQLPNLKKEMETAEATYNSYRQSRGSLDLNIETQGVLQSLVEVDNQIVALKQERDELRQSFTDAHPRIQSVDQRIERLRERRKVFDSEVGKLPDTQQKILRLARDVEVATTLYTNLVNTAQQLKVSKAGTVGDVRVIDFAAVSARPVGMDSYAVIFISAVLGGIVSLGVVWVLRSLRVVIEDPETIESQVGLPVYATIPHSSEELAMARGRGPKGAQSILAIRSPGDDAIESLRALRTTIHFALMDATNNSLLITGPSPGLGKSFVSKNLGVVLASLGQRIVIVDADLRKGHLNKDFELSRECGVSEFIAAHRTLEEVLKPTYVQNLWVVTTGQIPPNPSELLMHDRFKTMLRELEEKFDTVIVDAPPILAVSDAAIIGRLTGATLMVARSGKHPVAELKQAVKRMNQAGVTVKGFVFNDLDTQRQKYKYGYKGYVYRYSYGSKVE